MPRSSESVPSKEFNFREIQGGSFNKTQPGFFKKLLIKLVLTLRNSGIRMAKISMIVVVFSWFNLQNAALIKGVTQIFSDGEFVGGLYTIFTGNPLSSFKEAYNVGKGIDPKWAYYKNKYKIDLYNDFLFLGNHESMTSTPVTLEKIAKGDCAKDVCGDYATTVTLEEAQEYCHNNYGGYVPTYAQINSHFKRNSPLMTLRADKAMNMPELTSSRNPLDKSEYRIFFKNKHQYDIYHNKTINKEGLYINDDSEVNMHTTFRCFITL